MWATNKIELGLVRLNAKVQIVFQRLDEDTRQIEDLVPSCGCITPEYNTEKKQLLVMFRPNPFPKQFRKQRTYETFKKVDVVYEDGSLETLSFTATIIKH